MLFTEFEAVYEQFLFPGGVVFFVVDNINVPVMYKMFLLSPRAKHRVMRRWWVPNSDQAFIAVSDERKVRAIAGRSIARSVACGATNESDACASHRRRPMQYSNENAN